MSVPFACARLNVRELCSNANTCFVEVACRLGSSIYPRVASTALHAAPAVLKNMMQGSRLHPPRILFARSGKSQWAW